MNEPPCKTGSQCVSGKCKQCVCEEPKGLNPIIKQIAIDTHFNIYNSPIWNGTGERFVEAIIRECADIALREEHDPYECILKHFGIEN